MHPTAKLKMSETDWFETIPDRIRVAPAPYRR